MVNSYIVSYQDKKKVNDEVKNMGGFEFETQRMLSVQNVQVSDTTKAKL